MKSLQFSMINVMLNGSRMTLMIGFILITGGYIYNFTNVVYFMFRQGLIWEPIHLVKVTLYNMTNARLHTHS
jgi:hypothetical protein